MGRSGPFQSSPEVQLPKLFISDPLAFAGYKTFMESIKYMSIIRTITLCHVVMVIQTTAWPILDFHVQKTILVV